MMADEETNKYNDDDEDSMKNDKNNSDSHLFN